WRAVAESERFDLAIRRKAQIEMAITMSQNTIIIGHQGPAQPPPKPQRATFGKVDNMVPFLSGWVSHIVRIGIAFVVAHRNTHPYYGSSRRGYSRQGTISEVSGHRVGA